MIEQRIVLQVPFLLLVLLDLSLLQPCIKHSDCLKPFEGDLWIVVKLGQRGLASQASA